MQTNKYTGSEAIESIEPDYLTSEFIIEPSSFQQKTGSFNTASWKIAGVDDDTLLPDANREFIRNSIVERWEVSQNIHGKILKISHESVTCDCLINPETKTFQKRTFKKILFDHLKDIKEGTLVYILIRENKGSARIDVKSGKGIVDPKEFELNLNWDEFKELM